MNLAVEMCNISKYFNGKAALEDVNFSVKKGEIHCLLGENGAGKTTLMNILFGLYQANKGYLKLYGKNVEIKNTGDAFNHGLGMVHQHFMLIENMTVLQNIILGNEIGKYKIDYAENKKSVKKIIEQYGLDINLDEKVKNLSVGMKQRAEIIKALYRGADILVLDEPSAVLTPKESQLLMKVLKNLQTKGMTIIFITHKLNETMEIADRATILRNGKLIETVDIANETAEDLATKMVGHSIAQISSHKKINTDEVIFEIKNLKVLKNAQNTVDLKIRAGEIFGIAGVDGNGQLELEEMVMGLMKYDGEIYYKGKLLSNLSTAKIKDSGIGHIPSDRFLRAILPNMTLFENVMLGNQESDQFRNKIFVRYEKLKEYTSKILGLFNVKYSDINQNISGLSGGNQQKLVVAREISNDNDFILASQPSRGLDIGAIQFIHEQFVRIRNDKKSVMLISADLDEIMEMSDRIAVLYKGEIMAIDYAKNFTKERLGLLMAGRSE